MFLNTLRKCNDSLSGMRSQQDCSFNWFPQSKFDFEGLDIVIHAGNGLIFTV
jgi:hypothetical protein